MKQVRELCDATASIVLNKKGELVAKVQARYGSGGGVQVDVWSRKPGESHLELTHQGKAGGWGYDKYTAALHGAVIEGVELHNHCGRDKISMRLEQQYKRELKKLQAEGGAFSDTFHEAWKKKAAKHGCTFSNWCVGDGKSYGTVGGYNDIYVASGLDRLCLMGFRVIKAL